MGWDDRFDEISGDIVGCLVGVVWTRRYSQGTEYSLDVGASWFTLITLRRVRHTQLSSIGVERCNWQPWPSHASEP